MVEDVSNMGKEIVNEIQEAQSAPHIIMPRTNMLKHVLIKYKGSPIWLSADLMILDLLNGYKNKTHIYSTYKRPTLDLGTHTKWKTGDGNYIWCK